MKKKKCIICKFEISTPNYMAHGIPLCWKHDCGCRNFYQDRMFNDTKNVKREITMQVKNIVYDGKTYWVLKVKDGFEVYRKGVTHSTRCSQIGFTGDEGLQRAIIDCNNRENSNSRPKRKKKKLLKRY